MAAERLSLRCRLYDVHFMIIAMYEQALALRRVSVSCLWGQSLPNLGNVGTLAVAHFFNLLTAQFILKMLTVKSRLKMS